MLEKAEARGPLCCSLQLVPAMPIRFGAAQTPSSVNIWAGFQAEPRAISIEISLFLMRKRWSRTLDKPSSSRLFSERRLKGSCWNSPDECPIVLDLTAMMRGVQIYLCARKALAGNVPTLRLP